MSNFDPYDCLIPIFIETDIPRRTKQFATGIFVKNDMGYFIYTAAHVTDDVKAGKFLVPAGGYLQELDGYFAFVDLLPESLRKDDHVDVAYYKPSNYMVSQLLHHFKPAQAGTNTEIIESAHELNTCSVAGYPASKSKKKEEAFSSEIFSFTGMVADKEVYEKLDIDPVSNIILRFNKKKVVNPENGQKVNIPSMKGVSGGGIFAWPVNSIGIPQWSERKLVGIFHTYRERDKLIIGTALLPLLSMLTLGSMKQFGAVE